MRSSNSAQLGMSSIRPTTCPAQMTPLSISPDCSVARPRAPATSGRNSSNVQPPGRRSSASTCSETVLQSTRAVFREMVRMAVKRYGHLGDGGFVMSRQENLETIHQHNVVAERYGLISELRSELEADEHVLRHVSMREWLEVQ